MTETMPLLAVTPGEPAGIGPEILLRFHQEHPEFRVLAVADPVLLEETAEYTGVHLGNFIGGVKNNTCLFHDEVPCPFFLIPGQDG